eukprot:7215083-Pyramimonas_sp.AAC.1
MVAQAGVVVPAVLEGLQGVEQLAEELRARNAPLFACVAPRMHGDFVGLPNVLIHKDLRLPHKTSDFVSLLGECLLDGKRHCHRASDLGSGGRRTLASRSGPALGLLGRFGQCPLPHSSTYCTST